MSRNSIRIALTLSALNSVEIRADDIGNAYLKAECQEKIWTVAGTKFGSERGKVMLVVRAIYSLKSSGAAWRQTLAQKLIFLGYVSPKADSDV